MAKGLNKLLIFRILNVLYKIIKAPFFSKRTDDYKYRIHRGHNYINDKIFDFIIEKVNEISMNKPDFQYLDIGCNVGVILSELPGGTGVEYSKGLVEICKGKGLKVIYSDARKLPFSDLEFDVAILSCVLEQIEDWENVLKEAKRVARVVIGINPIPGSDWGKVGGYVKSVIPIEKFNRTEKLEDIGKYFFIC